MCPARTVTYASGLITKYLRAASHFSSTPLQMKGTFSPSMWPEGTRNSLLQIMFMCPSPI